jgi:NAD(P)-dependent dehydrogenase (short-subunit alcohol dehydrogenase family)
VVCPDIDPVRAKETVGLVVRAGGKGLDIACDVSVGEQVREPADSAEKWFGESISLVINAGIGAGGSVIGAISKSDWERPLLSTNHLSRSQLPPWRPASYTRALGLVERIGR